MRYALQTSLAAFGVLASVYACAGSYSNGSNGPFDPGPPGGGPAITADAGDAGDAGADAGDAGLGQCNGLPPQMNIVDFCDNNSVSTLVNVTQSNCFVALNFAGQPQTAPCSGNVIGVADAFDGGCGTSLTNCTSPGLPGTITCSNGATTCTLKVCNLDAGTCP
jgi:hypothetical protein